MTDVDQSGARPTVTDPVDGREWTVADPEDWDGDLVYLLVDPACGDWFYLSATDLALWGRIE